MWLRIVSLVVVYVVNIRTFEPGSCPASQDTVLRVPSCPRNREEWKQRSDAKKCSLVRQNCIDPSKFVYHCVINSYVNETLEVCAPAKQVIEHRCVEYNVRGRLVQESPYVKCSNSNVSCPFSYASTDVYKYQQCFQAIKSSKRKSQILHEYLTMDSNRSSCDEESLDKSKERNWQIVAVVMIIINVALFGATLWMMISKRKTMRCCKAEKRKIEESERQPLTGNHHDGDGENQMRNKDSDDEGEKETKMESGIVTEKRKIEESERQPLTGNHHDGDGENQMRNKDKFYVAAIDIGDRCCNMALCCSDSPTVVKTLGKWDRICLLLDEKGEFKAFGKDAIQSYKKEENDKCKLFYDFKLSQVPKKENGKVYIAMVSQLLNRMWNELSRLDVKVQHFVFIVPTYWDDGSIEKLRKWSSSKVMKILEIDNEKFWVIRRDKSISPIIHEVNARVLSLNFNVDNLVLKSDMTGKCGSYAILHIGSSYCDLTFWSKGEGRNADYKKHFWNVPPHEHMLRELGIKICGKTGKELDSWKKEHERDYISFLSDFEDLQNKMNANADDKKFVFEATIPDSLRTFLRGTTSENINRHTNEIRGITTIDSGCKIDIKHKFFEDCFASIKKKVWEEIEDAGEALGKVNCVVMTGTYSHMELVRREAEEKWFKDKPITVVIPENTQVFAMGGAYYVYSKVKNQLHHLSEKHND